LTDQPSAEEDLADEFETQYARRWLQQVMCLRWNDDRSDGELDEAMVEDIVQEASRLISIMSGQCASGASQRQYDFVDDMSSKDQRTSVKIAEAPIVEDSLGTRTWAAAPLLSAYALSKLNGDRSGPSTFLELGAGTGLVGIAVAKRLAEVNQDAVVHLTDYHTHVLSNLSSNISLNASGNARAIKLDWTKLDADAHSLLPSYDCLLAADCVYEESHARLLHQVATRFLAGRTDGSAGRCPLQGKLVLLSTLRSTHTSDIAAIRRVFPLVSTSSPSGGVVRAELRTTYEATIVATDEDHFGPPPLRLSGEPMVNLIAASIYPSSSAHDPTSPDHTSPPASFRLCIIEWCMV
jgi:predicted nicotinamide N-methyase